MLARVRNYFVVAVEWQRFHKTMGIDPTGETHACCGLGSDGKIGDPSSTSVRE
ncbi:MAG TPA: hypothetical protein VGX27_10120 [Candidatus Dormibacteraeota bacterium]|nr:hypothetical protein [Candidatus Dormibacteraeota bacterium]